MLRMLLSKMNGKVWNTAARMRKDVLTAMYAAFAVRYRDVLNACAILQSMIGITPKRLARQYMNSVMRSQRDEAWWRENLEYLVEPWFIYEYACENNLLKRAEDCVGEERSAHYSIEPEKAEHGGYVRIHVDRRPGKASCGRVHMEYEHADKAFRDIVKAHKFECESNGYTRMISEADGEICDRAIEVAIALLKRGCRVCVDELSLKERILAEDYEAEYPYWVVEGSAVDRLELRYPWDRQLHGYVYRAGGRWNGKTVEISICNAHLLDDLIRLYGFRITDGAKSRMDAWKETINHATIYRPRSRKELESEPPVIDRFKELMVRKAEILDDLYESDE